LRFEKRDYKDDDALDSLTHRIQAILPELIEASDARFRVFYSTVEPDHIGGKTRKLDGAVRHRTGDDFWILVHQEPFLQSDDFHKIALLIHEVHHIAREGASWVIRHHEENYCEIRSHDKYSYKLALKAMGLLGLKYSNEAEVREYAGLTLKQNTSTESSEAPT
jgi:hypothetical protein